MQRQPAFLPSLSLPSLPRRTGRSPRRRHAHYVTATTTPPSPPSTPSPIPSPTPSVPAPPVPTRNWVPALPPPLEITSNPLTNALYKLISPFPGDPEKLLSPLLSDDITWQTALFEASSKREVVEAFYSFQTFAIESTINIFDLHTTDTETHFTWTLSFIYPLPWRPRVSVSGRTTASIASGKYQRIVDEWDKPPVTLIVQSLPRLQDILWLYPAPHAETDRGQRRTLMSLSSKVEIVEFAPRVEMRMKARVKRYEENTIWATPALPNDVFEGGLRKRELYSTTAPVAIRKVSDVVREGKYRGGIYEWAIVVPGTHVGSGSVLIPRHEATRTEIVNVGKRVMAVRRFGGYAKEDEVKKWIAVVREVVEEKGWGMGLTWVRSYDAKVGFNERGLLSMAMYGSSDGVPRVNEIAAEIDGWEMS